MQTQITNTSGAGRFFGYILPHGVYLDSNESTTIAGDLRSQLAAGRGRYGRPTELAALQNDCDEGNVCLTEVADGCCSSSSA